MYPIWIQLLFVTGGLGITSDLFGVLKKISVVIPHFLPVKWLLCAGDVTLKGAVLYVGIEMDGFQFDTGFINYMVQCYGRYVMYGIKKDGFHFHTDFTNCMVWCE